MRCIISHSVYKYSALPPELSPSLEADEEQIFQFLQAASEDIGAITGVSPTVRVAGGWVRDKLLGVPSKDIDITVDSMRAEKFVEWLYQIAENRYGTNQNVVSKATTTEERSDQLKNLSVTFLSIFGQDVEVLPLRVEYYEPNNRNPITLGIDELKEIAQTESIPRFLKRKRPDMVHIISGLTPAAQNDPMQILPLADAYRRDLTINCLFYNLSSKQIEDMTGSGFNDLSELKLDTPLKPLKTFIDDPLRVLRVFRFYARYPNSKIAPDVIEAMKNPDIQHQIVRRMYGDKEVGIVPERTAIELRNIMMTKQPEKAVSMMFETGMLQQMLMLPEEYHPLNMDQKNKHHALTVIQHTMEVLKNSNQLAQEFGLDDKQRMMMNLTALFHDIGKLDPRSHTEKTDGSRGYSGNQGPDSLTHQQASQERWDAFAKALKLTDEESSSVSEAVLSHMNPHAHVEGEAQPSDKQLRKYLRKNPSWVFQYIHAMADAMSKSEIPDPSAADPYRANLDRLRALAPTADQFGDMAPAQDLLRGPDIIDIVGLSPRPPRGMTGYIEIVKELLREQQDTNPMFSSQEATQMVQNLATQGQSGQGPLAPYFQNVV